MPRKLIPPVSVLALILFALPSSTRAQSVELRDRFYGAMVEQLFRPPGDAQRRMKVILQFSPSFEPEEQILLVMDYSGSCYAHIYRLRESLWKVLGQLPDRGIPAVTSLRKLTGFSDFRVVIDSGQGSNMMKGLVDSASVQLQTVRKAYGGPSLPPSAVTVDGVSYKLVIETDDLRTQIVVNGPGHIDTATDSNPVIASMRAVRLQVLQLMKQAQ